MARTPAGRKWACACSFEAPHPAAAHSAVERVSPDGPASKGGRATRQPVRPAPAVERHPPLLCASQILLLARSPWGLCTRGAPVGGFRTQPTKSARYGSRTRRIAPRRGRSSELRSSIGTRPGAATHKLTRASPLHHRLSGGEGKLWHSEWADCAHRQSKACFGPSLRLFRNSGCRHEAHEARNHGGCGEDSNGVELTDPGSFAPRLRMSPIVDPLGDHLPSGIAASVARQK